MMVNASDGINSAAGCKQSLGRCVVFEIQSTDMGNI